MDKKRFGFFIFWRSLIQFLKIVTMFYVLLHLLYWIQHLIGSTWGWMNFAHPILDTFINWGSEISKDALVVLGAEFEYKYMIALCFYLGIYILLNVVVSMINELEYRYNNIKKFAKKVNEKHFNENLNREQMCKESKIRRYKIFVKAAIKECYGECIGYDLKALTDDMNRFLMEKTGAVPEFYESGFVYTFNNFEYVDNMLNIFMRLIKSDSPLDFTICVQVIDNSATSMENLKYLTSLNIKNKITMLSDTSYRYRFNQRKKYKTIQLGLYQKGNQTIEVQGFIEN